ncbi:polysaccharide deacetylase family protein [Haladaptatus sp. GCM10025707]|uniref:polysaccharide deacetylase family protein n=1 Tax=Haladaptatus sp. GCM10025707 TaxID=3252658 RepID=UPI00360EFE9A
MTSVHALPRSSSPSNSTRRRLLSLTGSAILGSLAGCVDRVPLFSDRDTESKPTTGNPQTDLEPRPETETGTPEPELALHTEYNSRERFGSPGDSFDDFEDLSSWQAVEGKLSVDTETYVTGSQSMRVTGPADEKAVFDRHLETPLNLAENDLSFEFRSENPGKVAVLVYAYDADDNWAVLELRSVTYRPPDVGWFRTCPGVFKTSETDPDLSQVERLHVEVINTADTDTNSWLDDMRVVPKADTGYVVLSWDDGFTNFYEQGAPLHDEYDVPAVHAYPPYAEESPGVSFMTEAQIRERQEAGDEIVSHATIQKRFSEISPDRLAEKLERNKQWLVDREFEGADFIVYPANDFDRAALDTISEYHYMGGMNQSGSTNTTSVYGFDPLVLPRTIGHDLDISKRAVDMAAAHNQCAILNFHHFKKRHTMPVADYEKLLQHITEKQGIEVITFSDLWELRKTGP